MKEHCARHRATELAALEDPEGYFETLGFTIEIEIDRLADRIAGPANPGEGYLERMQRLTEARTTAESEILAYYPKPGLTGRVRSPGPPRGHPLD